MEVIKFDMVNSIGMELFRKNNSTFLKDSLSLMMSKIFKAANSPHITDTTEDYYMKSGAIPNRVYYIYSNELSEKNPTKIYDIVYFNNEISVWLYSKNAINMIDKEPVDTIMNIYDALMGAFFGSTLHLSFVNTENFIAKIAMSLNLIVFLNETYGALDIDECKNYIIENYLSNYTEESAREFVEDICSNSTNKNYFNNREYLNSYILLRKKIQYIPVPYIPV